MRYVFDSAGRFVCAAAEHAIAYERTDWTAVEPPPVPIGSVARFVAGAWVIESDGAPASPTLAEAKAAKVKDLRALREVAISSGFTWDGSMFDSDQKSQTRILGAAIAALPSIPWRLADNSWRTLSAADTTALWGALQAHIQQAFATFAAREAQVMAATTVEQVQAVAW